MRLTVLRLRTTRLERDALLIQLFLRGVVYSTRLCWAEATIVTFANTVLRLDVQSSLRYMHMYLLAFSSSAAAWLVQDDCGRAYCHVGCETGGCDKHIHSCRFPVIFQLGFQHQEWES